MAEKFFKKALTIDSTFAEAQSNLAVLYSQQGKNAEAAQLFQQAIENDPKYPKARVNLGLLMAQEGTFTEAEKQFRAAIEVDAKLLNSYAGTYKTEQFPLDIKVFVKEGKLYLQATGQSEFAPRPKSPTVFEFPPAHIEVEFDSAASFTLKQGGRDTKFKKAVTQ